MTKERKNSAQSPAAFASRFNTEIKTRNRERRSASRRLAATQAAAGSGRNDLLPPLELVDIRLDDLKLSQRRLRKRDPAHIREVANSVARLGYSKPILIGPDNEVIDGERPDRPGCLSADGAHFQAQAVSLEDEVITARADLDLGKRYRETIFNFAKHREPGAYKLIIERKGAVPPPEI